MSEEKPRMTKKQAWVWAWNCAQGGTFKAIEKYFETNKIGTMAEGLLRKADERFTYGIEYGILIAVAKIFGDETEAQ